MSLEPHEGCADASLLEVRSLSKTFGRTRALDAATIELRPGQVHALLGQNGSGKSTLIKVLTGYHRPDPDPEVLLRGRPAELGRAGPVTEDGDELFVRTVHQDLGLIGGLSVVDNIALVLGYHSGLAAKIRWQEQAHHTRALLDRVGAADIDIRQAVDALEPLERAQVAIARALHGWSGHQGLLILDEPTATLPAEHAETLFDLVRDLRDGGVCVLYVSHRFNEILDLADHVTVLRDGRTVVSRPIEGLDHDGLVDLMLGTERAASIAETTKASHEELLLGDPSLRVRGLRGHHLRDLDFEVRHGEILGFAGLVGSGQEELPYLLAGATPAHGGTLEIDGIVHPAAGMTPRVAARLGVALVPADRANEALLAGRDLAENLSLPQLRTFHVGGRFRRRLERDHAVHWLHTLDVVPHDAGADVATLSGGNQQKVVIGRLLSIARAALVLAEPTAGVDVGAKTLIYHHLRAEAAEGLPVIVCSTDAMDLVALCDRVIVLSKGRPIAELVGEEITEDTVVRATLTSQKELA